MIVINGKFLTQRVTGVQRYAHELTKQLIDLDAEIEVVVPSFLNTEDIDIPPRYIKKTGIFSNTNLWEQVDLFKYLKSRNKSLLLSFCNTGPMLLSRQIICIHDMSYHHNPMWFTKSFYNYYKFLIPRVAYKSKHIVTVSNFSKQEICENLNISLKKVSVISNAPSKKFVAAGVESICFKKQDHFVFVGSHDPRKNIQLLLKVFSLEEYRSLNLVIIGAASKSFAGEEFTNTPNINFVTNCDDTTLAEYYKNARALINTSFYEGFGLPIIEAMASGCPLILSDLAAFKELAKKNAVYFDPGSQSSFKAALNGFINKSEKEISASIIENYNQSFKYNWKLSSGKLIDLIHQLNYEFDPKY